MFPSSWIPLKQIVSSPPEEVEIRLGQVEKLAIQTVDYLRTQHVEITDLDATTIENVTKLQVFAKVAHARRSGPFPGSSTDDLLVETIVRHFREGLKPMATLVEQVGRFEHEGKTFYPKVAPPVTSSVPVGYVATPVTVGTRRLYIQPIVRQPLEDLARHPDFLAHIPVERQHWSEGATVSPTEMIEIYAALLNRVMRKCPQSLIDVDLTSGKGTAAQLVGTRPENVYYREQLAWSKVNLPASVLWVGAGFGFGQGSNDYWHRYEGVVSEITANLAAFGFKLIAGSLENAPVLTVTSPPEEVEIRLGQVEKLANQAVDYLLTHDVEITDLDDKTIENVTKLQVFAKVAHARRSGPFPGSSSEDHLLVETIVRHFREGLKPMATLVEQVGRFEHEGKTFYPKVAPPVPSNVPFGYVATPVTVGTRRLYIQPIVGQPLEDLAGHPELLAGIPVERQRWSEATVSLTKMIENYAALLNRVRIKCPQSLIDVDLTSGKGTAAQLVGTRPENVYYREQLAWSKVNLPASVLCVGAGFGFGQGSNDYWHRYEGVVSEITADCCLLLNGFTI